MIACVREDLPPPDQPAAAASDEELFTKNDADSLPETANYCELNPEDPYFYGWIIPNKGLEEALIKIKGIELKHVLEINRELSFHVDYRDFVAGEAFKVRLTPDGQHVQEFIYMPNAITMYKLNRDSTTGKLSFSREILPAETRYRIVEGDVDTTLNQALIDKTGVSNYIKNIVNNALESLIDFRLHTKKHDKYKILIAEQYYQGEKIPGGRVLYAKYSGKMTGEHEAFWYEEEDPKSSYNSLYTEAGQALLTASLRYPLDKVQVASPFGMRYDPITGARQMHNGVDLVEKTGAPVYSILDGKVLGTGFDNMNGNHIVIKHTDGTTSIYLHLSKIITKTGAKVTRRQLIGRVGSTGHSTGPHLHFSMKDKAGKFLNPMGKKMVATQKLEGEKLAALSTQISTIKKILKKIPSQELK